MMPFEQLINCLKSCKGEGASVGGTLGCQRAQTLICISGCLRALKGPTGAPGLPHHVVDED